MLLETRSLTANYGQFRALFGVDVAIEALGTQATFEAALRVLRPGGTLSSLGVYSGDLRLPLVPIGDCNRAKLRDALISVGVNL